MTLLTYLLDRPQPRCTQRLPSPCLLLSVRMHIRWKKLPSRICLPISISSLMLLVLSWMPAWRSKASSVAALPLWLSLGELWKSLHSFLPRFGRDHHQQQGHHHQSPNLSFRHQWPLQSESRWQRALHTSPVHAQLYPPFDASSLSYIVDPPQFCITLSFLKVLGQWLMVITSTTIWRRTSGLPIHAPWPRMTSASSSWMRAFRRALWYSRHLTSISRRGIWIPPRLHATSRQKSSSLCGLRFVLLFWGRSAPDILITSRRLLLSISIRLTLTWRVMLCWPPSLCIIKASWMQCTYYLGKIASQLGFATSWLADLTPASWPSSARITLIMVSFTTWVHLTSMLASLWFFVPCNLWRMKRIWSYFLRAMPSELKPL